MAIAAWLVWRQDGFAGAKVPLALFGVQLALNVLWSCIFFGLETPASPSWECFCFGRQSRRRWQRSGRFRRWPEFCSCPTWPE